MRQQRIAAFVLRVTTSLAALSVVATLTNPDSASTGIGVAAGSEPEPSLIAATAGSGGPGVLPPSTTGDSAPRVGRAN